MPWQLAVRTTVFTSKTRMCVLINEYMHLILETVSPLMVYGNTVIKFLL